MCSSWSWWWWWWHGMDATQLNSTQLFSLILSRSMWNCPPLKSSSYLRTLRFSLFLGSHEVSYYPSCCLHLWFLFSPCPKEAVHVPWTLTRVWLFFLHHHAHARCPSYREYHLIYIYCKWHGSFFFSLSWHKSTHTFNWVGHKLLGV